MQEFTDFPAILHPKLAFYQKYFADFKHPLSHALKILLLSSDYACRYVQVLRELLNEDGGETSLTRQEYFKLFEQLPKEPTSFAKNLRLLRQKHFLRLLLRELAGFSDTAETLLSWSDFADALILCVLQFCEDELLNRYGKPVDEKGNPIQFFTLAMGKLGGRELNYSSDIDLIFAFSASGWTEGGEEKISNQQYYTKIVQRFTQLLQQVMTGGFVFRVDLRLRPNGESGALVSSLAALETYYQEQGRDWERYAMVKARVIDIEVGFCPSWFQRLIIPFVYRRYVDFSVIESLRSMKAMIEREVQLNPRLNDIKRGLGGIREVEFIIQNIQLIRGGRLPQIRQQNVLLALDALQQDKLLTRTKVLKQAYLFLRKLENALQSLNDQQTHSLPKERVAQIQVALLMGYSEWEELEAKLKKYQRIVSGSFHAVLRQLGIYEDENRLLANQLMSIWQGHVESSMAINLLASFGYEQADRCYQMISLFRHAPRCRRLTQAARIRLDRFMLLLLHALMGLKNTDVVLLQIIHLLENIVGRSVYLALLTENPHVLKELVHWFGHSPFITSLLVNHPFLLEILLEREHNWQPLSRNALQLLLQEQLQHCQDNESQEEVLRQFKLSQWLLAARAEMKGDYSTTRIARFLADVAQVILMEVLQLAVNHLSGRYPQIKAIQSRFAVIAYGKLGSREMNYNSDLDLVFIHNALPKEEALVTRLCQRILHMLKARSQSGILYEVDTRLRPSGAAGLLVSPMDAFVDYQQNQAWTWEHQALLKARLLSTNKSLRAEFNQLKKAILFLPREKEDLKQEILAMRGRINRYTESELIKHSPGGLLDLEFLVQFLVLSEPRQSFLSATNTKSQLQKLQLEGIISREQFEQLNQAYTHYHHLLHQKVLCPEQAIDLLYLQNVVKLSEGFLS